MTKQQEKLLENFIRREVRKSLRENYKRIIDDDDLMDELARALTRYEPTHSGMLAGLRAILRMLDAKGFIK